MHSPAGEPHALEPVGENGNSARTCDGVPATVGRGQAGTGLVLVRLETNEKGRAGEKGNCTAWAAGLAVEADSGTGQVGGAVQVPS